MNPNPIVGRGTELELLRRMYEQAAGGPVTLMVGGEAGVGKTRLIAELLHSTVDRRAYILRGGCVELGDGVVPYAPLIEALRRFATRFGVRAGEVAGPAWTELSRLIGDFIGVPAEPSSPSASHVHVFGAVMRVLAHLERQGQSPVVLLLEDLHWADRSTLDLIVYLNATMTTERVLLIGSYRTRLPPGHALRVILTEPQFVRRSERLDTQRFTESELETFLQALGPIDEAGVRRCFELSAGNAFFAEQLMTTGALNPGAGLPASLNELMLSRVQKLSADAKRVIHVAAAAGRKVSDLLLAAVGGLDGDVLDQALRECMDQNMLAQDPTDDTFVFQHELLREAVYGALLPGERRRLHEALARAIESDPQLRMAEDLTAAVELAHHWFQSGRKQEALTAAVRAGVSTSRLRAFHEAETQYKRALGLWLKVPDPVLVTGVTYEQLLVDVADAARWAGHAAQAVEFILRALAEVDPLARPVRAGELYERLGSYQWEAGVRDQSVASYTEALRLLTDQPPDAIQARALAALATADVQAGLLDRSAERAERAVALAAAAGATEVKGRALNTSGIALALLGHHDDGIQRLDEALEIATTADDLEGMINAYGNLSVALEQAGRLTQSVARAEQGLALVRRLGLATSRRAGVLANNAGVSMFLLGRWDEAARLLDAVLESGAKVRESLYARLTRAELHIARGQFEAAERLLGQIRDVPVLDPRFVEPLHACEAEMALWQGSPERADDAVVRGTAAVEAAQDVIVRLRLCAVGLRASADLCRRADPPPESRERADQRYAYAEQVAEAAPPSAEIRALLRLCAAERSRASGIDTADEWAAVADAWSELERTYPAAYARWREAVAARHVGDRPRSIRTARLALDAAEQLEAKPLRSALGGMPGRRPSKTRHAHDLTNREFQVLRLIREGLSDQLVGKKLGIVESTVGVHVHNLLRKLNVGSRGEAVALANRERLFDEPA